MANRLGDVELDARGMRALAHPVRLAILRTLRERGPSTATRLAPSVGASPSVTSWHLRHLAEHGLVEDAPHGGGGRSRWWRAVGRGFRFQADPADPEAASRLFDALEAAEGDLVGQWREQVRHRLDADWMSAATRRNTGLLATAEELRALDDAIEQLLLPLARRDPAEAPPDARKTRLLLYLLPSAAAADAGASAAADAATAEDNADAADDDATAADATAADDDATAADADADAGVDPAADAGGAR
ncbi:helix-turn-helix domain-containing protein [Actinocatenispora sera]|uniref:ArsR/SmtB family transcription factor n=1 Tax=Actinocatenispora sera TaxID=390989 RepID=UPI0033D90EA1